MGEKIAVFSDVHGSATGLAAVYQDAQHLGATDYWFVGDLLMPGPGVNEVWDLFCQINPSLIVRGNWDDLVINGVAGRIPPTKPSRLYFGRLAQYVASRVQPGVVEQMAKWPLQQTRQVGKYTYTVSHNLPDLAMGQDLFPTNPAQNFDRLFSGQTAATTAQVAIYAHVHHELMRYATDERLVLNPGSVGEPFNRQWDLQADTRAQYMLLEVDKQGIAGINYRHVAYDKEEDWQMACDYDLPYLELYRRQLDSGRVDTHNQELVAKVSEEHHYAQEYAAFVKEIQQSK